MNHPTDVGVTLKSLAEPMRWRIVELLAKEELCVCHIVEELGASQPLVSHHLKVLRDAGLVAADRKGYWSWYRLESDRLAEVSSALASIAQHAATEATRHRQVCPIPTDEVRMP